MRRLVVSAVWVFTVAACGPDAGDDGETGAADDDGGGAIVGEVGTRCETAGDCDAGLTCVSEFFFERRVCTRACETDGDCPAPSVCVNEVPDADGLAVGPYCLRPCAVQADCEDTLGSDCDTHESLTDRYCF